MFGWSHDRARIALLIYRQTMMHPFPAFCKSFLLAAVLVGYLTSCGESGSASKHHSPLTSDEEAQYLAQGKEIASAAFDAMSSQLMQAMATGGVPHAVTYCNTAAMPLADSLSAQFGAHIRRTSLKIRNPQDSPSPAERQALSQYAARAAGHTALAPSVVLLEDGQVAFYAPIMVKAACLACHGQLGTTLQPTDYAVIQSLYPQDAAIGYADGDWRGLWSITFERKQHTK